MICLCNTSPLPAKLRRRPGHDGGVIFKAAAVLTRQLQGRVLCHVQHCPTQQSSRSGGQGLASPTGAECYSTAGLIQPIVFSLIHRSSQMQIVYPHLGKRFSGAKTNTGNSYLSDHDAVDQIASRLGLSLCQPGRTQITKVIRCESLFVI